MGQPVGIELSQPPLQCVIVLVHHEKKTLGNMQENAEGTYIQQTVSCHHAVQELDLLCICHLLTNKDEERISIRKLISPAKNCNRPISGGNQMWK